MQKTPQDKHLVFLQIEADNFEPEVRSRGRSGRVRCRETRVWCSWASRWGTPHQDATGTFHQMLILTMVLILTLSPLLGSALAMASVPPVFSTPGTDLQVTTQMQYIKSLYRQGF